MAYMPKYPDMAEVPASFVIFQEGGYVKRYNCSKHRVDDQGTDAATVINNAITSTYNAGGGIVHLKPATYVCNSRLYMNNNVELEGEGYGTILKARDGLNTYLILIDSKYGCKIRNLQLDGNKANQTSDTYGVFITGAGSYDNVIEGCYIHDFRLNGIEIYASAYKNVVRNNRIESNGVDYLDGWCVYLGDSAVDNIVTLNRLTSNPGKGSIDMGQNCRRNIVTKNVIYDGGVRSQCGIMLYNGATENIVKENVIVSTYAWASDQFWFGIEVYTNSLRNIVEGNQIYVNNRGAGRPAGIQLDTGSHRNVIGGNSVYGGYYGIILISDCDRNNVSDNIVESCSRGIYIDATTEENNLIANNILYNNTTPIVNNGTGTVLDNNVTT